MREIAEMKGQGNMEEAINDVREYCSKFSQVVIYGAGDVGRMVADFMEEERAPHCLLLCDAKAGIGSAGQL